MSHPFQITATDADALEYLILKGTKTYTRQAFERKVLPRAEAKMRKVLDALLEPKESSEDDDKYCLPMDLNPEQHIFNLTFRDKQRPIKFIENNFREYQPEYGYWKLLLDEELQQRILVNAELAHYPPNKNGVAKSLGTAANVNKTMDHAIKKLWCISKANNKHLIAFRNGTVCTKTGRLSPHNPDNYLTTGLPYDYKPNAPCPPAMLEYIKTSFGADQEEYVRAALGLVLDLTAPDRFIHVIGPSGSGKGVFISLIMKFFGDESVGSIDNFKVFSQAEQIHQHVSGKRLLVIDDIVGYIGEEIGRFYTAVERTGMNARALFKPRAYNQSFDVRYAIASVGQLPSKYSNSKGWRRRVFPLPTIRYSQMEEDRTLAVRLENCLADIVSWALGQDKTLRDNILTKPQKYNEGASEYFREASASSSSAWAFIDECLVPVEPSEHDDYYAQTVNETQLYVAYKAYCVAVGKTPMARDSFIHELRQTLPLNWIDRRNGGKTKRRFVYIQLRNAFNFGEIGATCNTEICGEDGVEAFKDWAIQYGTLHPYDAQDLQALGKPPILVEPTTVPTPQPQPQAETVAPDHGCRDESGQVVRAWITPGKPEWWQECEHEMIQATTLAQLQEAKAKPSALRRTTIIEQWKADGRYPWLQAKEARLETEANSFEQPTLGQSPPEPEIIELPDDWETSLPEYTP